MAGHVGWGMVPGDYAISMHELRRALVVSND